MNVNDSYAQELMNITHVPWAGGVDTLQADLTEKIAQQVFAVLKDCGIEATVTKQEGLSRITIPRSAIKPFFDCRATLGQGDL